ncbi:MAG: zinc ribbon domain-containing protein [Acholeplasmataceae bacterium]|nr:zinc ribbon domain-containing protein [Acholeplasmataceae bacterium]
MAYCTNCGSQVRDDQDVCLSCGKSLKLGKQNKVYDEQGSTFGYAVLGFFIPIVGLVLYLMWKDERPNASQSAGKGALVGFILNFLFSILVMIILMTSSGFWMYDF